MNIKTEAKTILIAPLNWGLGHATRCILSRALLKNNYIPIIASMELHLHYYEKSSLQFKHSNSHPTMEYAENGANFKWN
jgi:hypothetical protein